MTISGQLLDYVRELYASGATQEDIAKKINLPQSSVARVLSGKKDVSLMTISTLEKAFPGAVLDLSGTAPASAPDLPSDGFFRMVLSSWDKLSNAQRASIAAAAIDAVESIEKRRSGTA